MQFATGFSRNIGKFTADLAFVPNVQSKRLAAGVYDLRVAGHRYRVTKHTMINGRPTWCCELLSFASGEWDAVLVGWRRSKTAACRAAVTHWHQQHPTSPA